MNEADPTRIVDVFIAESGNLDRRAPIAIGQFAVGVRRRRVRNSFSDIIGPIETAKIVEREQAVIDAVPKAPPRHGPAVQF